MSQITQLITAGASDGGVASCFDTANGEMIWRERIPGKYSASPLLADGRIYFCSQEGRTTVIEDGRLTSYLYDLLRARKERVRPDAMRAAISSTR